jgi:hypothetical protein
MAKVLCPACGINEMQASSQRCAKCAYIAKSIASRVKSEQFIKRMLIDRTLVVVMEPWQVADFIEVVTGAGA